jgi:hypothetical protein
MVVIDTSGTPVPQVAEQIRDWALRSWQREQETLHE